jgi:hypothetical protein
LIPFPHREAQSPSLLALQVPGQQLSPETHLVCRWSGMHSAVHVPWFTSFRSWQPSAGQVEGQEARGSQVSLPSFTPFPQAARQSLSLVESQLLGQQPSPSLHSVI